MHKEELLTSFLMTHKLHEMEREVTKTKCRLEKRMTEDCQDYQNGHLGTEDSMMHLSNLFGF